MNLLLLALLFAILGSSLAANPVRTYYIAAQEIDWDYAPSNQDLLRGVALSSSPDAMMFTEPGNDRIGKVYRKAVYREYTDATFRVISPRPKWLGILGPLIRAEVGDAIKVIFFNNATLPFSIHPHGVFYDKNGEGALYADGLPGKAGASISPGNTYTYQWEVRERAGPGPADTSSILWAYHSHVSEAADIYSGLIGPMIIYRKGTLESDGLPTDVDREFVALLMVQDENFSPYLQQNIARFTGQPGTVNTQDPDFQMSNMMHAINGLIYGNLDDFHMCEGEVVRWYALSFGGEVDLHTLHWHGQTLLLDGHRVDVLELLPASMRTLDMMADNPGKWMVHCHLNDHLVDGMGAFFNVSSITQCQDRLVRPTPSPTLGTLQVTFHLSNMQDDWIAASEQNRMLFEASFKNWVSRTLAVSRGVLGVTSIQKGGGGGTTVSFSVGTTDLPAMRRRITALLSSPDHPSLEDLGVFLPLAAYEDPSAPVTLDFGALEPENNQAGAIAGGVIGGLAAVALLGGLTYLFIKRRTTQPKEGVELSS